MRLKRLTEDPGLRGDAALDFRTDAIWLWLRDPSTGWREIGGVDLAAEAFAEEIAEMADWLKKERGSVAVDLWLPEGQVLNAHLSLDGASVGRRARAAEELAKRTSLKPEDLVVDLASAAGGAWAICAAEKAVVDEALGYARRWGFEPGAVTTRHCDKAFAEGPTFAAAASYRPVVMALGGAAGLAAAAVLAFAVLSPNAPTPPGPGPEKVATSPKVEALPAALSPGENETAHDLSAAPMLALAFSPHSVPAQTDGPKADFSGVEVTATILPAALTIDNAQRPAPRADIASPAPVRRIVLAAYSPGDRMAGIAPLAQAALTSVEERPSPDLAPVPTLAALVPPSGDRVPSGVVQPAPEPLFEIAAPATTPAPSLGDAPRIAAIDTTAPSIAVSPAIDEVESNQTPAEPEIVAAPEEPSGEDLAALPPADAIESAAPSDVIVDQAVDEVVETKLSTPPVGPPYPFEGEVDAPGPGSVAQAPAPTPRPDHLDMTPGPGSVAQAPPPDKRPKSIKPRSVAIAATGASAVRAPSRGKPTGKGLAALATIKDGLPMDEASLLGVFGAKNNRKALLRLADGTVQRVTKGAVIDGWVVTRIEATSMRMTRGGEVHNLPLVQ